MEFLQNVVEYYDELYPVTASQKDFYHFLLKKYSSPARLLRVGCATGLFEHQLAREGLDITGIEDSRELLNSAILRKRTQLMSVRYFEMSAMDMTKYLGKKFYNIISSLNDRILLIHGKTLMRKFFYDCYQLLQDNGVLVLQFANLEKNNKKLPVRESIRVKLTSELKTDSEGEITITQKVETGNGKILPVVSDEEIYPLKAEEVYDFAKEAGFSNVKLYSDFELSPFTGEEDNVVALIS